MSDATIRPYGWLDVTLGPNSTLSYVLPMVATPQGYDTLVEFHLDEMSVSSSVNYATFLKAETCRVRPFSPIKASQMLTSSSQVHVGLPSPLVWEELRTWTINVTMAKPDISLLRDHITLFTDVAKDWTSGPPGSYEHFVPYNYVLNFTLSDYILRLFVNDHNIINNPATIEDNSASTSWIVWPALTDWLASQLSSSPRDLASSPTPRFPPTATAWSVQSSLSASPCVSLPCSWSSAHQLLTTQMTNLALSMSLPDWNTHNAFLTERSRTFATTPELNIVGSYRFYSNAHVDNVERLTIAVDVRSALNPCEKQN